VAGGLLRITHNRRKAMKIKPHEAYRHATYPVDTALDPDKVYDATIATNQPDYQKRGLVFVDCPNGAPAMLLNGTEYDIA